MALEKDERNLGTRLVADPIEVGTVVVTCSNLELAAYHADSLCNSHVATEVEVGRVKTAQGTAPAIPCEQVFHLLGHPTIDPEFQAKINRKLAGRVSPALWSCHAPLATLRRRVGVSIAKRFVI